MDEQALPKENVEKFDTTERVKKFSKCLCKTCFSFVTLAFLWALSRIGLVMICV